MQGLTIDNLQLIKGGNTPIIDPDILSDILIYNPNSNNI